MKVPPEIQFCELQRRALVDHAMRIAVDPKAHPRHVADAEQFLAMTRPLSETAANLVDLPPDVLADLQRAILSALNSM